MPALPALPSGEHLRKQAKRLARERTMRLADAQQLLATTYGFHGWSALMRHVRDVRAQASPAATTLLAAVRAGDVDAVRRLLAEGENPRVGDGRETPLHAAARRGPLALVEALIAGGALDWQTDRAGRTPLEVARRGRARERSAIVALLDRSFIADPSFRAAVAAIAAGDVTELARLLDAEPRLLRERIVGPEAYRLAQRKGYFDEPKLFWFVANNPTQATRMPANASEIARLMIERGIDVADLDYTLALVMSGNAAREQGQQLPLMRVLLDAGATPTREAIVTAAAHRESDALRALVRAGLPPSALIAAALDDESLPSLLATANRDDVQTAFGLAVINGHASAARRALEAGADVNGSLPVHAHSTALHQAAADDRANLMELLLAHGARTDARDTLWDATPLDWAIHLQRDAARAVLERAL